MSHGCNAHEMGAPLASVFSTGTLNSSRLTIARHALPTGNGTCASEADNVKPRWICKVGECHR